MTFWAYMLHCRGGVFYVGHTDNLERRLAHHQSGLIKGFTQNLLPVELVWSQEFPSRYEALASERQIKGWSRAKKLALIRGDWGEVSRLAKNKGGASTSSARTGIEGEDRSKSVRPELVEGQSLFLPGAGGPEEKDGASTGSARTGVEVLARVIELILEEAAREHPREACGLLLGRAGRIERAVPAANVHPMPERHFEIDPRALIAAHKAERAGGQALLGYYHSHPTGHPLPSATDCEHTGDGRIWAIAAGGAVHWYRDCGGVFETLPTRLVDG